MPELPDVEIYIERLTDYLRGEVLEKIHLQSPFIVRTVDPPLGEAENKRIVGFSRMGKRIIWELESDLFLVFHLMVAGRLKWRDKKAKIPKRNCPVAFSFGEGTLLFTEVSKKKRASIHVVRGRDQLTPFDRGGLEVGRSTLAQFKAALTRENHTLKRALTDPRILSGIGNAYSDEILHMAGLSPFKQTSKLGADEFKALFAATKKTLTLWTKRLRADVAKGFPEKVAAFRHDMAVHGKYRSPCPVCGSPIQRIVYAENESNYCATCQTAGKLLADRALSKLLKSNWPRTLEELEGLRNK